MKRSVQGYKLHFGGAKVSIGLGMVGDHHAVIVDR